MTLRSNLPLDAQVQKALPASKSNGPSRLTDVHFPPALMGDNVLVCSLSDGSATYNRCFDRSTFFVQKLPFVMLARRFELKNVGVQGDGCLTFEPATCQDVVVMSDWQFHEDHCRRSPEQE